MFEQSTEIRGNELVEKKKKITNIILIQTEDGFCVETFLTYSTIPETVRDLYKIVG